MDTKTKLIKLYNYHGKKCVTADNAFFSFKITSSETTVYKPVISLFIPYLDTIVKQTYVFHKGWQPFNTSFHHYIADSLNPGLQIQQNGINILEIYKLAGPDAYNYYQEIVDLFEYYKILESQTINDESSDSPIATHCTIQEYNMRKFTPPPQLNFSHREEDLYSGSAYLLKSFDEPIHLGSFYHMSKENLDKNIKCLFL